MRILSYKMSISPKMSIRPKCLLDQKKAGTSQLRPFPLNTNLIMNKTYDK